MAIQDKNLYHGCVFHLAISYDPNIALIEKNADLGTYLITPNSGKTFEMLILQRAMPTLVQMSPKEFKKERTETYPVQFQQKYFDWLKNEDGHKALAVLLKIKFADPTYDSEYNLFFISPDTFAKFRSKLLDSNQQSFTISRAKNEAYRVSIDESLKVPANSLETYLKKK